MSVPYKATTLPMLGKWNILFVLSLMSGVLFQQTTTVWAQGGAAKPAPDVIVFTNGDQLTGTLERADGDSFVFKSDIVGEVTVPADKIKELRSSGKFVVLRNNEKITRTSKHPGTITYADNAVTVGDEAGAQEVVPVKDLAHLIDSVTFDKEVVQNPGRFSGWNGSR